ncbi:hypothetical protein AGR6A_Lc160197 [Agrobacterium sp. NCPPB 925]|nr:hypothetical protein AGR6A_Lc160197 [Agrobacterium sp. NCPPB 925]
MWTSFRLRFSPPNNTTSQGPACSGPSGQASHEGRCILWMHRPFIVPALNENSFIDLTML